MSDTCSRLNPEEQRRFQISFFGLKEDATWREIREHVRSHCHGEIFLDPDDWTDIMVHLYGSEIFE